jgi:hypothetical protein
MVKSDDTGKFILRVSLGVLILLHGIAKLQGGVGFISGMLAQHGLPGALAYLVYIGGSGRTRAADHRAVHAARRVDRGHQHARGLGARSHRRN